MKTRTILVPTQVAIVYEAGGWRFGEVPPRWWLEMTEPEVADAPERPLSAPGVAPTRWTSCRPGHGPCRRRHEHSSSPLRDGRRVPGHG